MKSQIKNRPSKIAFTLVELLVVITIIVVLLALMTPALDKAVYEAEMAVDAARLKSLGLAATIYTADHRRHYPKRVLVEIGGQPTRLSAALGDIPGRFDDRPLLARYMAFKNYIDPFLPQTDIEGSKPTTHVFGNYSMWFGYRFVTAGERGMNTVGDRFTWTAVNEGTPRPTYSFDLLASDPDHIRFTSNYAFTSHPDSDGILQPVSLQDEDPLTPVGGDLEFGVLRMTLAWWQYIGPSPLRGPVDLHYARENGSVDRLNAVEWNEWEQRDRIVRVPEYSTLTNEHPDWHQLPRP